MAHAITSQPIEKHANTELRLWAFNQILNLALEGAQSGSDAAGLRARDLSPYQLKQTAARPPLGGTAAGEADRIAVKKPHLKNHEHDSHRKAMEIELAARESIDSSILTAAPDSIISIDQHGEIFSFNQTAELTFGYRHDDALGAKFIELLIAPDWRETLERDLTRFFAGDECATLGRRMELMALRANGATFAAELTIVPLYLHSGPALSAFIRDISERKRTEALQLGQNRILSLIATGTPLHEVLLEIAYFAEAHTDGGACSILRLDVEGRAPSSRVTPSRNHSRISPIGELKSAPDGNHYDPSCTEAHEPALRHECKTCMSWPIFSKAKKILGAFELYFRDAVQPKSNADALAEICTSLAGIAIENHASEERIRYLAHYDGLTSLPNRFLFNEHLDRALHHGQRSGCKFAVLFIDLDKFKEINDTLGHDAGDLVLREIATRMRNCLRHTDTIARMGGDEFYVLVEDLIDSRHAADIAQKLLDEAARPVSIDGKEHCLSASIGISIYPDDGESGHALLQKADSAMYRAKDAGKDGYRFFSASNSHDEPAVSPSKRLSLPERLAEESAG